MNPGSWKRSYSLVLVLLLAVLACSSQTPADDGQSVEGSLPAPLGAGDAAGSIFDSGQTAYGFFPSPPKATQEAVLQHFSDLGDHADFILIQTNIPWLEFMDDEPGESKAVQDIRNQVLLAELNGMEAILVVDPLNGLDRREFFELPSGWSATFTNPKLRRSFLQFSTWLAQEFQPKYLGLASEINTYMDAHPADVEAYLSLYQEAYSGVKNSSAGTQVFVTFQWDDLNNMLPQVSEGRSPGQINWEQVELFEPLLDVWAISSYPYFVFNGGQAIPDDYYTPLLERTAKPLVVAEGGFSSTAVGPIQAGPADQTAYLEAIHDQLGERLAFWVYLLLNDLDMSSIRGAMIEQGRAPAEVDTLVMFAHVGLRRSDGTPKPALALWDSFRQADEPQP